jgi:hypothetical protein
MRENKLLAKQFRFEIVYFELIQDMYHTLSQIKLEYSGRTYLQLPLRQCLPLSVVQLKGKHCRKPHCHNGIVDTFGLTPQSLFLNYSYTKLLIMQNESFI